jgi:hypothetical protein
VTTGVSFWTPMHGVSSTINFIEVKMDPINPTVAKIEGG